MTALHLDEQDRLMRLLYELRDLAEDMALEIGNNEATADGIDLGLSELIREAESAREYVDYLPEQVGGESA